MNRVMIVTVVVAGVIWYSAAHTKLHAGGSVHAAYALGFAICIVGLVVGIVADLLGGGRH
jgi:hypothetical protein